MHSTYTAAKAVAVEYAIRDQEMWHVIQTEDGYRTISQMDREFWYQGQPMMFTADPIFLGNFSPVTGTIKAQGGGRA